MLRIKLKCRKITSANTSDIPMQVDETVLDSVENLKKTLSLTSAKGEGYAVVLSLHNLTTKELSDFDIEINVKLQHTKGGKIIPIKINDKSLKLTMKEERSILLFELTGIEGALFNAKRVSYKIENILHTNCISDMPMVFLMSELKNDFNGLNNSEEMETFFILDKYLNFSLLGRGILFRIMLNALEKLNRERKMEFENHTYLFTMDDIIRIRGFIQIDLVSKIMMYIEDLIIVLVANLNSDGNYYRLLNERDPDVGKRITDFFTKLDEFTLDDFKKMLMYRLNLHEDEKSVTKIIERNVDAFKKVLDTIRNFRDSHIQIHRRYKHALFPVLPGHIPLQKYGHSSKRFDSYSLVFGEDELF